MKYFLTLLILSCATLSMSQAARAVNPDDGNLKKAKALYAEDNYKETIALVEPMMNRGNENEDLLYMLASSYAFISKYEKAVAPFDKLFSINPFYSGTAYYESGFVYSELKQFDKAIQRYELFLKSPLTPEEDARYVHRAKFKLQYARQQKELNSAPEKLKAPVRMADGINSKEPEYLPMLDPTGRKLYFTSDRKGGISSEMADDADFDEDLFFIEKINGTWNAPQLMPEPINTTSNDGAASFSADGQMMVYGACEREDGVGGCDLYISYLEGNQWSKPVNMGDVVNSEVWDVHSSISYDGNKIIFVSNRSGGYGSSDLYVTERNVFGDWGIPTNLGSIVNTPFEEQSPFLSQDGKTLYFSSYGHPGYGGFFAGNPDLTPERTRSAELGAQYIPSAGQRLRVNLFYTNARDLIAFQGTNSQAINVNRASMRGGELEYSLHQAPWRFAANATVQRAVNEITDADLLRRPHEKLALRFDRGFARRGNVGIEMLAVSSHDDIDNITFGTIEVPGYAILNLVAAYPLGSQWLLSARVENLTDKVYENVSGYNTSERAAYVTLRYATAK